MPAPKKTKTQPNLLAFIRRPSQVESPAEASLPSENHAQVESPAEASLPSENHAQVESPAEANIFN